MQPTVNKPDTETMEALRNLVRASFACRDDLYAVAAALEDATLSQLCRRLAEENAGHAAELQQQLLSEGDDSVDLVSLGDNIQRAVLDVIQERYGDGAVLEEAKACEEMLESQYDEAMRTVEGSGIESVLERHRKDVDFGGRILDVVLAAKGKSQ